MADRPVISIDLDALAEAVASKVADRLGSSEAEPLLPIKTIAERMGCSEPTARQTLILRRVPIYYAGDLRRWKWSEVCAALSTPPAEAEPRRIRRVK